MTIDGTTGSISQLSVVVPQHLLGASTINCMKRPKMLYKTFCNCGVTQFIHGMDFHVV